MLLFLCVTESAGQTRSALFCGSDLLLTQRRKEGDFSKRETILNDQIRNRISLDTTTVYTIPIVFHILNGGPASITDQMIIDALKALNDAFSHKGIYGLDSNGADTKIQFCLAQTAPDGGRTSGINRINTYYENHDMDLENDIPPYLMSWDPTRYANVWLVKSIQGEIMPSSFVCGTWNRMTPAGYASAGVGAVVSALDAPLVAHELGHYLSLLHTFEGMNCANNDCTTQGDLVCDTPPDRSIASSSCTNPENSCATDTLSGPFTTDVKDNISNFMDYGSPCPSVFTKGQAARMRSFLEVFNAGSLISSDRCTVPCTENTNAYFDWNTNPHPGPGQSVNFNNTTTGAGNYRWLVNDSLVGSSKDLVYSFPTTGRYKVTLRAFNADSLCFSSYTGNVVVHCGVEARFSPDKRIIASQDNRFIDMVRFQNKSYGGGTYAWYITDPTGLNEQQVSTSTDLAYMFPTPGSYKIRLEAEKGTCKDSSPVFTLLVEDPIADALVRINAVDCYKNDSLRVVFTVLNNGYDTLAPGLSINFFDRPAQLPGAEKLNNPFFTKEQILGKCSATFTHIVAINKPKLDELGISVDNENKVEEKSETNNYASAANFQFRLNLRPGDTTVYTNTSIVLKATSSTNQTNTIVWSASTPLGCTDCNNKAFVVRDTTRIQISATSTFGCQDKDSSTISVFPVDLGIFGTSVDCYKQDSLLISTRLCMGNGYTVLKKDVALLFYQNDSSQASGLLGRYTVKAGTSFVDSCITISSVINMSTTGRVYIYVNPSGQIFESTLGNNLTVLPYNQPAALFSQQTIEVLRGEPTKIDLINGQFTFKSVVWSPANILSCTNCLNPMVTTNTNTTLRAIFRSTYDCLDTGYIKVLAYYQQPFTIPNAFTPNGDGLNDFFYVIAGKEVITVKEMQVFNRWGEKVFERKNIRANEKESGWNGSFKGKPGPMGTYVYLIVLEMQDGSTLTRKGNVTIVR